MAPPTTSFPTASGDLAIRLQVTANFTAELLGPTLEFWCRRLGFDRFEIAFSSYSQVLQELLDPTSASAGREPGANFFLVRVQDFVRDTPETRGAEVLDSTCRELVSAFREFLPRARRSSVVFVARTSPTDAGTRIVSRHLLESRTRDLTEALRQLPGLVVIDHAEVEAAYPTPACEDAEADRLGHIPFLPEYWTAVASTLMRRLRPLLQTPCKVIVVDADNTLWEGVIAEAGADGITVGPSRQAFQRLLRGCREHGLLLALASKNREQDVEAAFRHPEMILRREDFVAWKVHWRPKSESVRELATDLELGLEGFVFLDDNPVECAEVTAHCPQAVCIQVPADGESLLDFARHLWVLDLPPSTAVDRGRGEQYRQQAERRRFRAGSASFREFLAGLNLEVDLVSPRPEQFERAAQLTQRTNQFNATGVRRTAAELGALLTSGERKGLLVSVRDRFGDYGEVGLCLFHQRADELIADTFLLSCRVLGKGVEHLLMASLGETASRLGLEWVVIPFRRTDRNEPAARFLDSIAEAHRHGATYRIPAAVAAAVTFNPVDDEPPVARDETAVFSRGEAPTRDVDFAEIARDLTTAGRIHAAVRRAFQRNRESLPADFTAPSSAVEARLVLLWEEVLGVAPIGVRDGFLDLGGQSIQAAQVASRIARGFGRTIPIVSLLRGATIAEIARELANAAEIAGSSRIPVGSPPCLSPAQERLWFLDQFLPRRSAYNIIAARRIRGPFDPAAWGVALKGLVARHPPLRTTVRQSGETRSVGVLEVPEIPIRVVPAPDEDAAMKLLREEAETPFQLAVGPLVRSLVVRVEPDHTLCLLTVHHIAADGWSINLMLDELGSLYSAAIRAAPVPALAPLARSYFDYAAWISGRLAGGAFAADLDFWRAKLAGAPRLLELPTDFARPSVMTYEGAEVTGAIGGEARRAIDALAVAERTTPFAVLLAAFQVLLHRYTGQTDILIGMPVSGRNDPAFERLVGCFINTVVIRTGISGATTFREQIDEARTALWDALEHDGLPFEKLVDALDVERDLSHSPIFQVMLVLQNSPPGDFTAKGLTAERVDLHNGGAKFDLVLEIVPQVDGYHLALEYSSALFRRDTACRMLGHFVHLLETACRQPGAVVGRLPLMPPEEREAVLKDFSEARATFDPVECLHHSFERQAAADPEAPALTWEGSTLSYLDLNQRANRLAHSLVKLGVGPDTLVGVCLERSADLVVAILAVLKAGGAYLPIDLSYPPDRLAFMIEDAQAPVLISQAALSGSLPPLPAGTTVVDVASGGLDSESDENPATPVGPGHLAYVIYTSGSTGKPKGCMVTHRNVARLMRATEAWYGFGPKDVWTLFHSCAFDFSVWEIWGALLYGGRLVVVPYLTSRSPEAFYELLSAERVTVLNQTPSAFRQLIQAEETVGPRPLALRYVVFGGEALEMRSLRPWFERHGDEHPRLVNMYGITETTVHVTYRPLSAKDVSGGSVIGVPIRDLEFYILDPDLNPTPIGVPGEIYVGGAGVARGYLRREALTGTRFIPHPFRSDGPERLYRTGDLARFLPGRDVEYLGRIDQQVKIRGFRIELGEIESVLCLHPAVRQAVVVAREDAPGEKRLAAYLVVSPPPPPVSVFRDHLKAKLPEYMVPSAFVILDQIPLTANGKVDHRRLPPPEPHRPDLAERYVGPRTTTETCLASIWARVLRLERVGIHDNFFELGGDSILSLQIISLARQAGLGLTLRALFAHQTIAELATDVDLAATPEAGDQGPVVGDAPLTPIQLWFFERRLAAPEHYNQALLLSVREPLDLHAFRAALSFLETHHDALRLRFPASGGSGRGRQQFAPPGEAVSMEVIRLDQVADTELAAAIRWQASRAQSTLRLEKGPIWRVLYLMPGAHRPGRLLMVIHHLAVDAVSWRILLEDLETVYGQVLQGRPPALPPKTASFKRWADLHYEPAHNTALLSETSTWCSVLRQASPTIPVDFSGGENTEASTAIVRSALDPETTSALLQRAPSAYNTRINDLLLAALAPALAAWTGEKTVALLLEGHGREDVFGDLDVSRTVGWFTTMHPIVLNVDASEPGERIKSIKEQLRRTPRRGFAYLACRHLPVESPLRSMTEPPIVFNYLGQWDSVVRDSGRFQLAEESTGPWHGPAQTRRQFLEIDARVIHGTLEVLWTYSRALHKDATIESLARAFESELRQVIGHCLQPMAGGATPSDFPLCSLTQAEVDALTQSGGVEDIYPLTPIQALFHTAASTGISVLDQWSCTLAGRLDADLLRKAWNAVIARHSILRTDFRSVGSRDPVQVVRRSGDVPWTEFDWRGHTREEQDVRWTRLLEEDRARGMALDAGPLLRFHLARVGDEQYRLLWSVPALLLDGWSWPRVFRDLSLAYGALADGGTPAFDPARSYRDYVAWLAQWRVDEAEAFWRDAMRGFREPTPLEGGAPVLPADGHRIGELSVRVPVETAACISGWAASHQVSPGALIHAAWALTVARLSARADVVFGSAFAGRPPELPGAETIVGPLVNNLPVRVRAGAGTPARGFVAEVHQTLLRISEHQFASLEQIQSWSEVPWRFRLFGSLLVLQNYDVDDEARHLGGRVAIEEFRGPVHTNYPLLVLVEPRDGWRVTFIPDCQVVSASSARRWQADFLRILGELIARPGASIGVLLDELSVPLPPTQPARRRLQATAQNAMPPQTDLEKRIARTWHDFFQVDEISVQENLFDLGAHSLLVSRLHQRLRQTLDREFPLVALFQFPTIRSLAAHLEHPEEGGERASEIQDRGRRQRLALARPRRATKL